MKKLNLFLFLIICGLTSKAQFLDISNNKGMILPVVPNVNTINNPSEGLILYNQNTKSLNFNNGSNWQNLYSTSLLTGSDSITYTISGIGNFQTGSFQLISLEHGAQNNRNMSTPGTTYSVFVNDLTFTKLLDANSWVFNRNTFSGAVAQTIEFKFFKPNTLLPYYSIKLNEWVVSRYYFNIASSGIVEQISINFTKISIKDWVRNNGFTYDISTRILTNGPYN